MCPQCLRCQIMEIPEPRAISPLEIGTKKKEIYNGRTSVDELEEELRLLDYLMLQDELNASFILIAIFIIFCTTGTLCLVFVPKVKQARNTRIYVDMIYQWVLFLNRIKVYSSEDSW